MDARTSAIFPFSTEIPFSGKFGNKKKNQHCQFKLKFGTYTNSNMQISMVILTFSVFGGITPFGQTWPKKSKCKFKLKFGIYNLGHNILEFYNVLIQIRLTKSNTKRDT